MKTCGQTQLSMETVRALPSMIFPFTGNPIMFWLLAQRSPELAFRLSVKTFDNGQEVPLNLVRRNVGIQNSERHIGGPSNRADTTPNVPKATELSLPNQKSDRADTPPNIMRASELPLPNQNNLPLERAAGLTLEHVMDMVDQVRRGFENRLESLARHVDALDAEMRQLKETRDRETHSSHEDRIRKKPGRPATTKPLADFAHSLRSECTWQQIATKWNKLRPEQETDCEKVRDAHRRHYGDKKRRGQQ